MPEATPPTRGNADEDPAWPVAVVRLIDRCLGSPKRFRRLLVLLVFIVATLMCLMVLATTFHMVPRLPTIRM
ncbi:hypothetical protein ACWDKQ_20600 [Saccharopolyspora sp. NPDC000995]